MATATINVTADGFIPSLARNLRISDADLTHIRERHEAITQDELETTAAPDESEKA